MQAFQAEAASRRDKIKRLIKFHVAGLHEQSADITQSQKNLYTGGMCGGIKYIDKAGKEWAVYFPSPKAALPVLKHHGEVEWFPWGKRKEDSDPFAFAPGGWARLDSIKAGRWEKYSPRSVLLPVQKFMEKDADRKSHWFNVPEGQAIQGLLASREGTSRVYVVTEETPAEYGYIHDRWPRLVLLRKKYKLEELMKECAPGAPILQDWEQMPSVGKEI